MGEMRDSGKETGPHRSFVPPRPSSFLQPPLLPFSPLILSLALSPAPCPPPDCPLFINAIKETECRASTVGFLPCRCREPAVRSGRIYAGKRIHHSRRQRGLSIYTEFASRKSDVSSISNRFYPSDYRRTISIHPRCRRYNVDSRFLRKYVFISVSLRATKTCASHILYRNDANAKIAG